MKRIFYEKVGRRYKPVHEYDSDLLNGLPKGSHLLMVHPGGSSTHYNVNPNYVALIAAGRVAEDAICKAISKASELRPAQTPITPGQQEAWIKLSKEFGEDLCMLNGNSPRDIAEAGLKAMQVEADKLLTNPAVKKAYEHFQLVCELTKEQS
jgi:hypothetical protein